jgi:hypothetical protein
MQTQLTKDELTKIAAKISELQYAERVTGVDWRLLAGIWYRENSLNVTPPSRVGGVWQFDPPLTSTKIQNLLNKYSTLSAADKQLIINDKGISFKYGAILAACFLRDHVPQVLDVRKLGDLPDDTIGNALYTYNGKAYGKDWHMSPYVYNNGDDQHIGLKMNATLPTSKGRIWIKKADTRLGAFVVYRQLKELYPRQQTKPVNQDTPKKSAPPNSISDDINKIIKEKQQENEQQKTISLIDGKIIEPLDK